MSVVAESFKKKRRLVRAHVATQAGECNRCRKLATASRVEARITSVVIECHRSAARQNVFFFFSSRRRHTRSLCDWSSDVCFSDLAAHEYFLRSEQIPTRVRLAVAQEMRAGEGARHRWRAGGILLQFLPKAPERARQPDLHPGDAPEGTALHVVQEDDAWVEGRSLMETVDDDELIDPTISSERLLYRLFHERGVRVFRSGEVKAQCSCSRGNVEAMLKSFSQDDRDHMVENGQISVTCEFCSAHYVFAPGEVAEE